MAGESEMTESNTDLMADVPLDEIRSLVDERARYEAWIEALESRRAASAEHVYQRVRGDYDARLQHVLADLGAHVGPMEASERALAGRQDELTSSLSERHDELAEAELRTVVGEYDADEGERIRREKEEDITRMDAQRDAVVSDLTQVRSLLERARSGAQPDAVTEELPTEPASETAGDDASEPAAAAAPEATADASADTPAAESREADEVATRPSTPAYGSSPMSGVGRPTPNISSFAPDTFTQPRTGGPSPSTSEGFEDLRLVVDGLGAARDPGVMSADASTSTSRPAGRADPFGAAADASSAATSAPAKTLRCQECGTMNFPTEWYCERCGGELAAL